MKKWIFIAIIIGSVAGYWNFRVYQKTQFLSEFCQPFIQACESASGCIIAPIGWQANKQGSYEKDMMEYTANSESFILRWHIGTDAYLVASGGKNIPFKIESAVE